MKKELFNDGWMVAETEGWLTDSPRYEAVEIPCDMLSSRRANPYCRLSNTTGYVDGSLYEFKKDFFVPEEWKGQTVMLEFDGVMSISEVTVNRNYLLFHPNGYTPFIIDLTPYLLYGKSNRIVVRTDSELKSSRWYTGCGIYRDVFLRIGGPNRINPWGLRTETVSISSEEALQRVHVNLELTGEPLVVEYIVYDSDGSIAVQMEKQVTIETDEEDLVIFSPSLWSPETPVLYRLVCNIKRESEILDTESIEFGVRTIQWEAGKGLLINGEETKLRGGCLHHTSGILGAVSDDDIELRKIRLLKSAGYNAVRTAHNPPSAAFLRACDREGMYVISEFFDAWRVPKCVHDYHMFFNDWWERDITATICRDYNHPSLIMWSIGNEITEEDGTSKGFDIARMLSDKTRELDPVRPITSGMILLPDLTGAETAEEIEKALAAFYPALSAEDENSDQTKVDNIARNTFKPQFGKERDYWGDTTKPYADTLDIVGYNYMSERYEFDVTKFPDRLIVGTETFPGRIFEYWEQVKASSNVIGDFCWTAMDFLGEAGTGINYLGRPWNPHGEYPCRVSGTGDFDISGFRRPISYYRQTVWGESHRPYIVTKSPKLNGQYIGIGMWGWDEVESNWTFPGYEGVITEVTVYSDAEEVTLYLNDCFVATKAIEEFKAHFSIPYAPGCLEAISHRNGKEIGRTELRTAGEFSRYDIVSDENEPDSRYLYFRIIAVDHDGVPRMDCQKEIQVEVEGARMIALGTGEQFAERAYTEDRASLYKGSAQLIIKRQSGKHGRIVVHDEDGVRTEVAF